MLFRSLSDDDTVALARAAGADVAQQPFDNYAAQRNAALDAVATHWVVTDWVFFVDADERATPALAEEIRRLIDTRAEHGWAHPTARG